MRRLSGATSRRVLAQLDLVSIFVCPEPRGIDVGAKSLVLDLL